MVGAATATAAHAQLVHISATSDDLFGEVVGYPQASRPMGGTAKFNLYYDASVVGTNGIFTFNDPKKNYWTVSADFNPYDTDPNAPLYVHKNLSFALETMRFGPATEDTPATFALTAPAGGTGGPWWFDFGVIPSGPTTALPVPPFKLGGNFNSFYVIYSNSDIPFDGGSIYGARMHNYSAEILSPVPEPSVYGIVGTIAALCCTVYNRRRRALTDAV